MARYGLEGTLDALKGADRAEAGDVVTPRGSSTSWRQAAKRVGSGTKAASAIARMVEGGASLTLY